MHYSKALALKSRTRQESTFISTSNQQILNVLTTTIKQAKEIKLEKMT